MTKNPTGINAKLSAKTGLVQKRQFPLIPESVLDPGRIRMGDCMKQFRRTLPAEKL